MSTHRIRFHVVERSSTQSLMLPLVDDLEVNQAILQELVGFLNASHILDLIREGHISTQYKAFDLLPLKERVRGFEWILMMGLGEASNLRHPSQLWDRLRSIVAIAARHFRRIRRLTFAMPDLSHLGLEPERAGQLIAEGAILGLYRFERYKSAANRRYPDARNIEAIEILCTPPEQRLRLKEALEQASIGAVSTCMARDWVNMPALDLTPKTLVKEAKQLSKSIPSLHFETLNPTRMEAERLSLHLAVAQGSSQDPYVILLTYSPKGISRGWDLALVGQGITFDAHTEVLSPEERYGHMSGAATVLSTMRTIALRALPINVVAVIPLAESLQHPQACKAGDVILSRKGLTVEITHPPSNGRLILADALAYACDRFKPRYLIDVATISKDLRTSLGSLRAALFVYGQSIREEKNMAQRLLDASLESGEWLWQLPLDEVYQVQLQSQKADLINHPTASSTEAQSMLSALFLKHFVDFQSVKAWAHLDIRTTSIMLRDLAYDHKPYHPKEGATGMGVRLLERWMARWIAE